MSSIWLSETSSESALTAILLGPLDEPVLLAEAKASPKGILWIRPDKTSPPPSGPANVHSLAKNSPTKKLSGAIEEFIRLDYDHPPTVKVSSRISEDKTESYTPILDLVISSIDHTLRARRTRADTGVLRQEQVFRNLSGYLRHRVPETWKGSAKGTLAVVVGAGPSLDVTLPMIKKSFPAPLVVTADSALRALGNEGIDPHFVVSIDPEKNHESCTSAEHHPGIAVLSTQSHSSWSHRWGEKARYLSGRVLTEDWLAAKGIPKTSFLALNNAGLTALLLADFLGPDAILLVGMDLAGGGTGNERYAESTGRSHIQIPTSKYHQVPGNHSETVPTPFLSDWSETSELCAKIAGGRHIINLNDRGARLEGATLIHPDQIEELRQTLADALHSYVPPTELLAERRGLSGPGLDQVLNLLATRCDETWRDLRIILEEKHASNHDKLRYLRELLGNQEIASLFGDYAFAVMPEIAPGKEPDPKDLDIRLRELQRILWILEDAMVEAEPSDDFLVRLLTDTFA